MSTQLALEVLVREQTGKKANKLLRHDGRVPCVVYGASESAHFSALEDDLRDVVNVSSIITMKPSKAKKDERDVLVKDVQRHCITGTLIHVDFYEITRGVAIQAAVPVEVHGEPAGLTHGGRLEIQLHEMTVECLPKDLPAKLDVDVSALDISESLTIADVVFPEGVEAFGYDDDAIVALVKAPRGALGEDFEGEEDAAEGEEAAAGAEAAE